jgi:site-specific DNA-methyltransferase (adenine-specific)
MSDIETNIIHTGDCLDVLDELPTESVHACVTDPPYGLAFMGRDWDDFEPTEYQQFCENWASEVKRVLKPGGHLLAFSGNRTHHRLFTGVEDAGYEIRDTLTWHYGSGFPKASDISKTIDKRADAEREVVAEREKLQSFDSDMNRTYGDAPNREGVQEITEPATDAAKQWDGWKTGLKPATEYVVVARKPFSGATVDCVLEHGTGALNIDGTRIETSENLNGGSNKRDEARVLGERHNPTAFQDDDYNYEQSEEGRYPSNVVFGAAEAERLDREVGDTGEGYYPEERTSNEIYGNGEGTDIETGYNGETTDSGGPSRYFYTSKASKAERTLGGRIDNAHPTVKPADLMEWLVTMVSADQQIVVDPFAGSGTTLRAAKDLDRQFVGIERDPEWADVARVRTGLTPDDPATVRGDDDQQGLEAFTDGGQPC